MPLGALNAACGTGSASSASLPGAKWKTCDDSMSVSHSAPDAAMVRSLNTCARPSRGEEIRRMILPVATSICSSVALSRGTRSPCACGDPPAASSGVAPAAEGRAG